MKRFIFVFTVMLSVMLLFCSGQLKQKHVNAADTITSQDLMGHVRFLASDEMRGRNAPSPELEKCADYISDEFRSYGLKPSGDSGSYYQVFYLQRNSLDLSKPGGKPVIAFALSGNGKKTEYKLRSDYVPLYDTGDNSVNAPVVFAGYGITAPELNYNDYTGMDVKGKIVLVMTGEPQHNDPNSVFNGKKMTEYASKEAKIKNAMKQGAVGLMLVKSRLGKKPENIWPSLLGVKVVKSHPTLYSNSENNIPAVYIHTRIAEKILKTKIKVIVKNINKDLKPKSFEIPGVKTDLSVKLKREKIPVKNVLGLVEGSDPELKDEVVIIGGHYDHIGVRNDSVFNGADDNASGTASVLELAEAFASSGKKPARSILFITFTAEELGLVGSEYYTDNPVIPLEKTTAMLNIDMIGRNDPDEIFIIDMGRNPDLKSVIQKANTPFGLKLSFIPSIPMGNSDHYPFAQKGIPVLGYYSNDNEDTHQPGDDIEKLLPGKMERVTKLVFLTAKAVANSKTRPKVFGVE